MRNAILPLLVLGSALLAGPVAFADEAVPPHEQPPAKVVPPIAVPPPNENDAVIEHRVPGCETTSGHHDNSDGGTPEKKVCK